MGRRVLAALIVLATIGFIAGMSIERHGASNESAAHVKAERATTGTGETAAEHAAEGGGEAAKPTRTGGESAATTKPAATEPRAELRPLGVDIEALPFVVVAALLSLGLAAGAWVRPRSTPLLVVLVVAMLAFAALDVREIVHQSDESRTGLALLAGLVAALHLAAAATGAQMTRDSRTAGRAEPATPLP